VGLAVPGAPYRAADEVERFRLHHDPVELFRVVLSDEGFTAAHLTAVENGVDAEVADAVRFARESPSPDPATLYDYLYSNPVSRSGRTP